MAEHEPCIGNSSEWFTPPEIFEALGLTFDLDPCSPGPGHWVPARKIYTAGDDGLHQPREGLVFVKEHANGVAIVRAYTSSAWFHRWAINAETMLFPRGKTKFVRPDGSIGRARGHGIVLLGMGAVAKAALASSGLGWWTTAHKDISR
jgi:hypothetical protein